MSGRLEGKVAVVTGGVSGIGLASVELAVAEGARVIVGDIQDELGFALQARFKDQVLYRRTDVREDDAIGALVSLAVESFGKLDIMYNNAGAVGDRASLLDLTATGMDETHALLTRSVLSGHTYAGRQFVAQGTGGAIVSTSSAAGLEGGWASAAYTISKHAVLGIVRQAAAELGRLGIRSNAICPGVIMTPIMAASFGVPSADATAFENFLQERLGMSQPSGRFGLPSDVAEAFVFLASDGSRFINGAAIPVDGGATAVTMSSFAADVVQAAEDFNARTG